MEQVLVAIGRLVGKDRGQDLLEYALLVALIAIVAVAAVMSVGNAISQVLWGYIASVPI